MAAPFGDALSLPDHPGESRDPGNLATSRRLACAAPPSIASPAAPAESAYWVSAFAGISGVLIAASSGGPNQ
jgi:hypothetical protein